MKKIAIIAISISGLVPFVAVAANNTFREVINYVVMDTIIAPLVPVLISLTILIFIWGIIKYMREDGKEREDGKKYMFWGVIGIFVMVSVWGLVAILQNTFDLNSSTPINTNIDLNNLTR